VISNGVQVSRTVDGELATTHWRMTDPMATYLAFFAAGDFAVSKGTSAGTPWLTAVSRGLPDRERRHLKRIINRSGPITAWLESELGNYPFDSTGGLVSKFQFGFALENQSRPIYGGFAYRGVVVHELAHQWFGDSVSVHRWRDIWLNEGFATYMEWAYAAAHGGQSTRQRLHDSYDSSVRDRSFWRVDIADPGAGRIFDYAVYERGAMALAALRSKIGNRTFDRLLRQYLRAYHADSAKVPEFRALAEEAAGHDLGRFFRVWLSRPEPPAKTARNGF